MIKVDIISGFLGSGKTTLISKLIKESLNKSKLVLIENEFGEIGIDGGFLKEAGVVINEMNSGCICCSLVGDFEESLKEVINRYQPERIVIEPSGVGKLSDIIKAVNKIDGLSINTYACVVDAGKAKMYSKNFKEFFNDQIASASCVILSKTQNVSKEKLEESLNIIRGINEEARIVTTNWADLSGDDILKAMEGSVSLFEKDRKCSCGHDHHHDHDHHDHECDHDHECTCNHEQDHECSCDHDHNHECSCGHDHHHVHDHHHHADDVFTSLGFETINRYSKEKLAEILSNLDEEILRAKGIVQDDEGKWLFFDYVSGTYDIRDGSPSYTGLITVIGPKGIDIEKIKEGFGIK